MRKVLNTKFTILTNLIWQPARVNCSTDILPSHINYLLERISRGELLEMSNKLKKVEGDFCEALFNEGNQRHNTQPELTTEVNRYYLEIYGGRTRELKRDHLSIGHGSLVPFKGSGGRACVYKEDLYVL